MQNVSDGAELAVESVWEQRARDALERLRSQAAPEDRSAIPKAERLIEARDWYHALQAIPRFYYQ